MPPGPVKAQGERCRVNVRHGGTRPHALLVGPVLGRVPGVLVWAASMLTHHGTLAALLRPETKRHVGRHVRVDTAVAPPALVLAYGGVPGYERRWQFGLVVQVRPAPRREREAEAQRHGASQISAYQAQEGALRAS